MTSQNQYYEKTLKSASTFLGRWAGAHAQLWDLTISIRTLRIVLQAPGREGNLVLLCLDPISIRAPMSWDSCQLVANSVTASDGGGLVFQLVDVSANVEIYCSSLEIKENVKLFGA